MSDGSAHGTTPGYRADAARARELLRGNLEAANAIFLLRELARENAELLRENEDLRRELAAARGR